MDQGSSYILALHEECTRLCAELELCLQRERKLLVEFNVENLPHTTLEKESLISALAKKRRDLKEYLRLRYGIERISDFGAKLEEGDRALWLEREKQWQTAWARTRDQVRRNQDFLKSSLRNLTALAENLRRSLGEPSLYSSSGARVDLQTEGKVVAASY